MLGLAASPSPWALPTGWSVNGENYPRPRTKLFPWICGGAAPANCSAKERGQLTVTRRTTQRIGTTTTHNPPDWQTPTDSKACCASLATE